MLVKVYISGFFLVCRSPLIWYVNLILYVNPIEFSGFLIILSQTLNLIFTYFSLTFFRCAFAIFKACCFALAIFDALISLVVYENAFLF